MRVVMHALWICTCLVSFAASQRVGLTTHVYSTGEKGEKGDTGDPGVRGPFGPTGIQGDTGAPGPAGDRGQKGDEGEPGVDGILVIGATGSTGPSGVEGLKGDDGATGAQGVKGAGGSPGGTGQQGAPGLNGVKGTAGVQGPPGSTGAKGVRGGRGLKGAKGNQGATGARGVPGASGDRGSPGIGLQDVVDARAVTCAYLRCIQATCEETLVGAICTCRPGFQFIPGSDSECQDIDECKEGACPFGCTNTEGSYTCSCPTGFQLDTNGRNCKMANSACNCDGNSRCVNLASEAQCVPSIISISTAEGSASLVAKAKTYEQRAYERTNIVNENWVTVFLVWCGVLTVVIILLSIWMVNEYRISKEMGEDNSHYETINPGDLQSLYGNGQYAVPHGNGQYAVPQTMRSSQYTELPYLTNGTSNGGGKVIYQQTY